MAQNDTAQILAALGIPTGPGLALPAGAGNIGMAPAATLADPQRTAQIQQMLMGLIDPGSAMSQVNRVPKGGIPG